MQAEQDAVRSKRIPWKWLGLAIVLFLMILAGRILPLDLWLEQFNEWVSGVGSVGPLIYALVYAVATVLFIPGSVLTIGAGFIFGLLWGALTVSLGSTLGAALAFLTARYLARDRISEAAGKSPRFAAVDEAIGRQGWKIIFLLRLSPVIPFNLSNYLYGLTAVPFWQYIIASWIGMMPGTLLYVYLGVAGKAGLDAAAGQGEVTSSLQTAFLIIGLAATFAVTIYVSHLAKKALKI